MHPQEISNARSRSGGRLAAALAAVLALAAWSAVAAQAQSGRPGDSELSQRLELLAAPELRSAARAEQAAALSLATAGPGSLLRDGGRVLVEIRVRVGTGEAAPALRRAGAQVLDLSPRYRTVTAAVRPADLRRLAAAPEVLAVTEVLTPAQRGADCGGLVRSEGDAQLNAAPLRPAFAVDGTGVTVGILSDSFDLDGSAVTRAPNDVASGDLPGPGSPCGSTAPVGIVEDSVAGGDEGRAMAQIVHDLAPGAAIQYATAFTGEAGFANNIRRLANSGSRVIVDDVAYFEEPFFQDGPVAVAVGDVTAAGVSYFSAAGNDNVIDAEGNEIGSWEAPQFRDSDTCPPAFVALSEAWEEFEEEEGEVPPIGLKPENCVDFDPDPGTVDDTLSLTVAKGGELSLALQWAEPRNGVATDLDIALLDENGDPLVVKEGEDEFVVASLEDNVGTSQRPFEYVRWENESGAAQEVQLVINRFSGGDPRLKFALMGGDVIASEYAESSQGDVVGPTIYGHSGSEAAVSVAAVPFNDSSRPETYSSRGPVKHFFGPVRGAAPAGPIGARTIAKPDLAATDCNVTTFFAFRDKAGAWRFCGTSAAAPHAAAVAALIRQANPGAGVAQIRAALTATALPVGGFGPLAVGAGLIDAYRAVSSLALPPLVAVTRAPAPLSRERRPTLEFTASRPVSFFCSVDGAAPQPCASPYTVPAALADGTHGFVVTGTDVAGRGASSGLVSFRVDTTAPRTRIAKRPRKLIRTRKNKVRVVFRFRSNEPGAGFVCKVDRELLRHCNARIVRRLGPGKHFVKVRATDAAGNADRTPAVFRFRIKRVG